MRNRLCTEHRSSGWFRDQKGGQMLRTMEYDYAVVVHAGDWAEARLYDEALTFNAPPKPLQISAGKGGTLPPQASLLSIEPANLILSALKQAEEGDGVILRVYNPTRETLRGRITLAKPVTAAHVVNLNEQRKTTLAPAKDGAIELDVPAGKIITLELEG
jgi:alpha-mannosidase